MSHKAGVALASRFGLRRAASRPTSSAKPSSSIPSRLWRAAAGVQWRVGRPVRRGRRSSIMRMHGFALAAALALATLGSAGGLDREFKAGDAKGAVSTPKAVPEPASKVSTGTELDDESPTQAHRRGWGGGWGGW